MIMGISPADFWKMDFWDYRVCFVAWLKFNQQDADEDVPDMTIEEFEDMKNKFMRSLI